MHVISRSVFLYLKKLCNIRPFLEKKSKKKPTSPFIIVTEWVVLSSACDAHVETQDYSFWYEFNLENV